MNIESYWIWISLDAILPPSSTRWSGWIRRPLCRNTSGSCSSCWTPWSARGLRTSHRPPCRCGEVSSPGWDLWAAAAYAWCWPWCNTPCRPSRGWSWVPWKHCSSANKKLLISRKWWWWWWWWWICVGAFVWVLRCPPRAILVTHTHIYILSIVYSPSVCDWLLDDQHGESSLPGRIVADAIAAAAAHKSNGLMKLVRHRDETLQLMLSSVEHEWSSSPPEAVRGTA